jgi:hypothetical protein
MFLRILFKASFCQKRLKSSYPIVQGTNRTVVPGIQFRSPSTCAADGQEGALTLL